MFFDSGETTFDLQDTTISDLNPNSGGAFTATKYNTKFIIDDLLVTSSVSADDNFGKGVCAIDNTIFVGAPDDEGNVAADGSSMVSNDGTVTCFDCNVAGEYAWKELSKEQKKEKKSFVSKISVLLKLKNNKKLRKNIKQSEFCLCTFP